MHTREYTQDAMFISSKKIVKLNIDQHSWIAGKTYFLRTITIFILSKNRGSFIKNVDF